MTISTEQQMKREELLRDIIFKGVLNREKEYVENDFIAILRRYFRSIKKPLESEGFSSDIYREGNGIYLRVYDDEFSKYLFEVNFDIKKSVRLNVYLKNDSHPLKEALIGMCQEIMDVVTEIGFFIIELNYAKKEYASWLEVAEKQKHKINYELVEDEHEKELLYYQKDNVEVAQAFEERERIYKLCMDLIRFKGDNTENYYIHKASEVKARPLPDLPTYRQTLELKSASRTFTCGKGNVLMHFSSFDSKELRWVTGRFKEERVEGKISLEGINTVEEFDEAIQKVFKDNSLYIIVNNKQSAVELFSFSTHFGNGDLQLSTRLFGDETKEEANKLLDKIVELTEKPKTDVRELLLSKGGEILLRDENRFIDISIPVKSSRSYYLFYNFIELFGEQYLVHGIFESAQESKDAKESFRNMRLYHNQVMHVDIEKADLSLSEDDIQKKMMMSLCEVIYK